MNATSSPDRADTKNVKDPAPSNSATAEPARGSAPPATGRDDQGRFVMGNKGGPGNPFARRTARLRSLLLEAATDEDMQVMAQKLVELAKAGDLAAIKLLFGYVIGKPVPCADPDRLDVDEWELTQQAPLTKDVNAMIEERLPADLACAVGTRIVKINGAEMLRILNKTAPPAAANAAAPSANGKNRHTAAPSANGKNGHTAAPSANGKNRQLPRALLANADMGAAGAIPLDLLFPEHNGPLRP